MMLEKIDLLLPLYAAIFGSLWLIGDIMMRRRVVKHVGYLLGILMGLLVLYFNIYCIVSGYVESGQVSPYIDVVDHIITLVLIPCVYLYIGSVTQNDSLSFKTIGLCFLFPLVWSIAYVAVVCLLPHSTYQYFVVHRGTQFLSENKELSALNIVLLVKLGYNILQFAVFLYLNIQNIKKYRLMFKNYYSRISSDAFVERGIMLFLITAMELGILLLSAQRQLQFNFMYAGIFAAIIILVIAFYGTRIEPLKKIIYFLKKSKLTEAKKEEIAQQLYAFIIEKKRYLQNNLTIVDVSFNIGISPQDICTYLNMECGQYFNMYVNKIRMKVLVDTIIENPLCKKSDLLVLCGFRNKRDLRLCLKFFTGMNFTDLKKYLKL